ncbi:MAG: EamA family transporter [Verrucomicrobiota bacterium]|jgi:drug/metabolite transporter (DMT)-like permease
MSIKATASFVLLCAIWGSTWLVIKESYGGLGPFNAASIRFLIAGALTVPLVPLSGARWPQGKEWLLALWVGATLFTVEYGLIYWGEQWLDSGITAVTFSVLPILTAVGAHFYLPAERLTPRKLAGTLAAMLGVAALFGGTLRLDSSLAMPMLAILVSAVFAALASLATKKHGRALHPAALNAASMLVGGVLLAAASLAVGDGYRLPAAAATWAAIGYLAIAGSVVTFLIFFWLLKIWSATSLSFIAVFTPALALLLGFVLRHERPSGWSALGAALILGGVLLAVTNGQKSPVNNIST